MAKNTSLGAAKQAKEDEFYTQRSDIENELYHYAEHFRGKVVYCNCDDPVDSEFWKFFVRNFQAWGLKKLIATHYEPDALNFAYKLEIEPDEDGQFSLYTEPTKTPLPCNGDFRSAACVELLQEADIVVTNPPFSLFREFVGQLIEYGKKFLIIGNQNAVTYKEVFSLMRAEQVWLGYYSGDMAFRVPSYYEPRATRYWEDEQGQKWRSMGNACWFTNLDVPKRHVPIDLRGNYYNPEDFPKFAQYDAIEVSKLSDIPSDYDGVMGVPITYLSKHCPEQFEILGMSSVREAMPIPVTLGADFVAAYRAQGGKGHFSANMYKMGYYDKDGKAIIPYNRVLIRKRGSAANGN